MLGFRIQFNPRDLGQTRFRSYSQRSNRSRQKGTDTICLSAHNLDQINTVDKIDPDHECEALTESVLAPGGSGANTAYTLGRLGAKVHIAGIIGDDTVEKSSLIRSQRPASM